MILETALFLSFAILALLGAWVAKLQRDLRVLAARRPDVRIDEDVIGHHVERVVRRDVLDKVFESVGEQLRKIRDDNRRATRREFETLLELPEWHARLEQTIEQKLVHGAFDGRVRELVEQELR